MNAPVLSLAAIARALGGKVKGDHVLAPGPGHSPADRSLSVSLSNGPPNPDGFVVHSFAGDDGLACKDYVRDKLGIPGWTPGSSGSDSAERIIARMTEKARGLDLNEAAPQRDQVAIGPRIVAEYVYQLADGTPYLRVQRTRDKQFWQSHWTGSAWAKGRPQGPKVPYRLPEMLAAVHDTVFVVEGEKDADALAVAGFAATTAPEGAGKWSPDLNPHFVDKTVYILADNDEAGAKHARQVAENLVAVAADVRIVDLPGLPPKGDVSDWLARGGKPASLIEICKAAFIYRTGDSTGSSTRTPLAPATFTAAELRRLEFEPIRYVVPGYIAEGCTLLAGRPKLGKSWLMMDVGVAVATGGVCLGNIVCEQGDVLYLALEDHHRRLQSRLDKVLGAFAAEWPKALHLATEWPRANEGGVKAIRDWIEAHPAARLVIVDVMMMFRPVRGDKDTLYEADYNAIKGLQALAGDFGIAIVVVHHTRKSGGGEADPFEKVSGTLGLSGAADSVIVLDRNGNGATLYGRGRDIEEFEAAVVFDKPSCRWTVLGEAGEVRRTDERGAILALLDDAVEPMTPSEIGDAIGAPRNNIKQLLFKMAKAGEVQKTGRGRYIHPDRTDLRDNPVAPDNPDNRITTLSDYRRARVGDDIPLRSDP